MRKDREKCSETANVSIGPHRPILTFAVVILFSQFLCLKSALSEEQVVETSRVEESQVDNVMANKLKRARSLVQKTDQIDSADMLDSASGNHQSQSTSSAVKMFQGLGLCVGFFLVGVYFVKRFKGETLGKVQQRLSVLDRIQVGPKSSVLLLQLDRREVLIAVGSEPVTFLTEGGPKLRARSGIEAPAHESRVTNSAQLEPQGIEIC